MQTVSTPPQLSRQSFARLSEFITRELGIRMPDAKLSMLHSRLLRRLRELQMDSIEAYETYLFESADAPAELAHFFDVVTTNKTDFFREPAHFDFLSATALPTLAREWARPDHWNFKLWCAGCSSGQEAYTLAMVLAEYAERHAGFGFSVLATDISTRVLEQAQTGIYPEQSVAPVPMALRKKYLLRSRNRGDALIRIGPELRARVRFGRLNFMEKNYGVREEFDVIFFRNVMIYFEKPTQQAVINRLCRNLRPGGYFFISHSESLAGLDVPLSFVGNSVFRKLR